MKKILMTGLLFLASRWVKRINPFAQASIGLTKLKFAMGYLQTIKAIRLLFLSLLGAGISLVFLVIGIVLIHLGIILYAPWSAEVKMFVTLSCAAGYVIAAVALFYYVFSEDKWLKMFNADKMLSAISGSEELSTSHEEERKEFAKHR